MYFFHLILIKFLIPKEPNFILLKYSIKYFITNGFQKYISNHGRFEFQSAATIYFKKGDKMKELGTPIKYQHRRYSNY
jgi:hypothetical protein